MKECILDSQEQDFSEMDLFVDWRVTGDRGTELAEIRQDLRTSKELKWAQQCSHLG